MPPTASRSSGRLRRPTSVALTGEVLEVPVRESPRARRLRLVVRPDASVEIVVPRRATAREIEALLVRHREWLERTLDRARARATPVLGLSGALWLGGEAVPHAERVASRASARLVADAVIVAGPDRDARAEALERWYRREARYALEACVASEADRLGLEPGALAIRDPRSRWGSCSSRGTLSFSWRLVVAPPEVLRYVVVHELCHLRELNHSRTFWRHVEDALPDWRDRAGWLRRHGEELRSFAPADALG